jgi:hypothetical protein
MGVLVGTGAEELQPLKIARARPKARNRLLLCFFMVV